MYLIFKVVRISDKLKKKSSKYQRTIDDLFLLLLVTLFRYRFANYELISKNTPKKDSKIKIILFRAVRIFLGLLNGSQSVLPKQKSWRRHCTEQFRMSNETSYACSANRYKSIFPEIPRIYRFLNAILSRLYIISRQRFAHTCQPFHTFYLDLDSGLFFKNIADFRHFHVSLSQSFFL